MLNNFWMVLSVLRWILITCRSDLLLEGEELIKFLYFIKYKKNISLGNATSILHL